MPFAGYQDWDECIAKNKDKGNPEAYCGKIKHQVEDKKDIIPPECLVKAYKHYKERFPNLSERDIYDKTFAYFRNNDVNDFINTCDYNQDGKCINERNENYKKECPYENIDKCPTSDFVEDFEDLSFTLYKEKKMGEIFTYLNLYKGDVEIGGAIYAKYDPESGYIPPTEDVQLEHIEVKPEYRGKGYGKKIMEKVLEEFDKNNWSATLGIAPGSHSSYEQLNKFYEKYGFREYSKEEKSKRELPTKYYERIRERRGNGKGWFGESKRHSKARKFGKADTLDNTFTEFGLKKTQPEKKEKWVTIKGRHVLIKEKDFNKELEKLSNIVRAYSLGYTFETRERLEHHAENLKKGLGFHNIEFIKPMIKQELDEIEKFIDTLEYRNETEVLRKKIDNFRKILNYKKPEKENTFTSLGLKRKKLDMILLEIAQEYEQQVHDFLTTDAEGQPATHLQEQFEQLKELEESARTPEARALRKNLGGTFKPPVESIDVPFTLRNSETGAIVRGSVRTNFDRNTTQLTPVSSSNVRGVGRFNDELLVQFHGNDKNPMRTYRYKMQSPEMAEEAYSSLTNSSSPGRWVWENIRGHRAGEPKGIQNVPEKYGKALQPWSKTGRKVIGGTTSSLVEYNISNRVPVSRVSNFEAMSSQMKRKTSNPSKNPNTGSRIEGELEGRRQARDRGVKQLGAPRQVRQLPKLDFAIHEIDANDLVLDYKVRGHYRTIAGKQIWVRRHTRGEGKSIKDKPRMKPLPQYKIEENYHNRLATLFGKEEYSDEINMYGKKDYFFRDFHRKIYIANNVNYLRHKFTITLGNGALKMLPIPFQDLADIVFYNKITDDPNFESDKKSVPPPYKKVGWNSTYEEVDAQISYVYKTIRIKVGGYDHANSVRHEVGHAVYWWKISEADRQRFKEIYERKQWYLRRQDKVGKYQANNISEFFAVQFQRYYNKDHENMFPETISYFNYINEKFGGENKL